MRASFSADAWQGGLGVITALEKTFMPGKGGLVKKHPRGGMKVFPVLGKNTSLA